MCWMESPLHNFSWSPVFSLQILSPMANGLFHKAIMESGVAILPLVLISPGDERKKDVSISLTPLLYLVRGECGQVSIDHVLGGPTDHGQKNLMLAKVNLIALREAWFDRK